MEPLLLSIPEAGKALGIARSKTYDLIAAKKLRLVKLGRRSLVTVASVRALASDLSVADEQ